jgi:hypothetical protein
MSDVLGKDVLTPQAAVPPRKRLNASMNSKGMWQLDATVETYNGESPVDQLVDLVNEAEKRFRSEGKVLAG